MNRRVPALGILLALFLTGCGSATNAVAPGTSANVWIGNQVVMGSAPSPTFPISLAGWRLSDSWSELPRVFSDGGWTDLSGPGEADFPSTMNGCADQRFLIRWRAVDSTAKLEAGIAGGGSVTANAGWMGIDGCEMPRIQVVSFDDGASLTDVTIDVQRWVPAP